MIVTIDELKAPLKIEHDDEDTYLASLIARAQGAAEDYCRVSFEETDPVPEPAKQAVLLMACYHYEHPDMDNAASYKTMRAAFEALLYPHRDETKML